MFTRTNLSDPQELLLNISCRKDRGVCFVRMCGTDVNLKKVIYSYFTRASSRGVILDGQIKNPDERQLSYFAEILGNDFKNDISFFNVQAAKWMPRMKKDIREDFCRCVYEELSGQAAKGKPESVLKNIYVKVMCWMYYKFDRLTGYLGEDDPPRIMIFSDGISAHELILLRILNCMGSYILMLELNGDAQYLKYDAESKYSQLWNTTAGFTADFSMKTLNREISMEAAQPQSNSSNRNRSAINPNAASDRRQNPNEAMPSVPAASPINIESRFTKPKREACTNAWMESPDLSQILTPSVIRGKDNRFFYNAYIRLTGVPDRLTFKNEIYQLTQKITASGRNLLILNDGLSVPSPEEVSGIRRHNYRTAEEMIIDLAGNLPSSSNIELQRMMQRAFVSVLKSTASQGNAINRLTISAVYLLCWIRKFQSQLFKGYKDGNIACIILNGGCRNENECLYLQYLSKLPVDTLILVPDMNRLCCLQDSSLLDITGEESLQQFKIASDSGSVTMMTAAAHAARDLDSSLYTDTGFFRSFQFASAESITLKTTFDEIFILWKAELKYRPNFSADSGQVNIPVIYAKINGIEKDNVDMYWHKVKQLLNDETILIKSFPISHIGNPYQQLAVNCLKNGKIRREELRKDRKYPFGIFREVLQDYILDKVQMMIDNRMIRGTFENGTEYTILATILNLKKEWLRMIQAFDFTRRNPKVVCISTGENICSTEDSIMLSFLNLIGFDIVMFVPTGYQVIEQHLNASAIHPIDHQIGSYKYDLSIPDFNNLPPQSGFAWFSNIFKRGT